MSRGVEASMWSSGAALGSLVCEDDILIYTESHTTFQLFPPSADCSAIWRTRSSGKGVHVQRAVCDGSASLVSTIAPFWSPPAMGGKLRALPLLAI
jgi:hypothetical protein